jgi:hypothetical protein
MLVLLNQHLKYKFIKEYGHLMYDQRQFTEVLYFKEVKG